MNDEKRWKKIARSTGTARHSWAGEGEEQILQAGNLVFLFQYYLPVPTTAFGLAKCDLGKRACKRYPVRDISETIRASVGVKKKALGVNKSPQPATQDGQPLKRHSNSLRQQVPDPGFPEKAVQSLLVQVSVAESRPLSRQGHAFNNTRRQSAARCPQITYCTDRKAYELIVLTRWVTPAARSVLCSPSTSLLWGSQSSRRVGKFRGPPAKGLPRARRVTPAFAWFRAQARDRFPGVMVQHQPLGMAWSQEKVQSSQSAS